jgi:anti-sigma factor RsiW
MLTCQQMTELVTAYLEGALPWSDRFRFQLHLGTCRHCRRYLRQMRTTVRLLGRVPAEPVPDAVMQSLLAQFRAWK